MSGPRASIFKPLEPLALRDWARPERLGAFDRLAILPLADTEVLHLAHYAPIAIAADEDGHRVVALIHPTLVTTKQLNASGRWSAPYAPIALRCLPFRQLAGSIEIAPSLMAEAGTRLAFRDEAGKPTQDYALVIDLMDRLARGGARLATAAKFLMLADVLSPLNPLQDHPGLQLFVVNSEKLRLLPTRLAAMLTADQNLPFELAAASIFSLRHLDRSHIGDTLPPTARETAQRVQSFGAPDLDDTIDQPVTMDTSALFSIEDFLNAELAS